jgi:hypothetical protein
MVERGPDFLFDGLKETLQTGIVRKRKSPEKYKKISTC